jgi:ribosomal-protein-alanine N-acetyltransferase
MSALHRPAWADARTRPLALEPLTGADVEHVWELEKRAYSHPWSLGNFTDSLRAGYPAHMLTSPPVPGDPPAPLTASGHTLLGYFLAMKGVDEVHLLNIAVAPEHRRQGWGLVMLQALATWSIAEGAQWLWLEARAGNVPALGLYRRFGFAPMGVRKQYYPAGGSQREDAVVMSLNLLTLQPAASPLPQDTALGTPA